MAKKTSIRYKILLFLTAIPLLTLSLYLMIAIGVFKDDKLAYVFDTSSSLTRGVAAQSKAQFLNLLNLTKPIFQEYVSQAYLGPVTEAVFNTDPTLLGVQIFRKDAGSWKQLAIRERTPGSLQNVNRDVNFNKWLDQSADVKRIVKTPMKDRKFILIESLKGKEASQTMVFVTYFILPELADVFQASNTSNLYLISSSGEVLLGPKQAGFADLSTALGTAFLSGLNSDKMADGVKLITAKGKEWISSYGRTGFSDLFVVGLVDKDKAFGAVTVLVRKSMLFFGLLICVTLFISVITTSKLTESITELFQATKRVAQGQFNVQVKVNSSDEIGSLAESFNVMASEISRLLSETAEKARMEGELNTARTVQETLFPPSTANLPGLKIHGHYEPASECGGDWWYYGKIGEKYFLWIGDATGHGAPAALLTSAARSASTIIERLNISPSKALELLNRAVYDVSKGNLMMTFFLAAYDPKTGELSYCNASHEPPFLIRHQEGAPKKRDLIPLNDVNEARLGQKRETTYAQKSVQLGKGDLVLFFSDGIPGITNEAGEEIGERNFLKSLLGAAVGFPTPEIVSHRLLEGWNAHRGKATLADDVTFFVIQSEGATHENS